MLDLGIEGAVQDLIRLNVDLARWSLALERATSGEKPLISNPFFTEPGTELQWAQNMVNYLTGARLRAIERLRNSNYREQDIAIWSERLPDGWDADLYPGRYTILITRDYPDHLIVQQCQEDGAHRRWLVPNQDNGWQQRERYAGTDANLRFSTNTEPTLSFLGIE